jgi:signal transduction histidine kinase
VHALRPDALERDNFWDALKGIIKDTTAGTALHTTFELHGKLPELPRIWQENLLHIGQEALTNKRTAGFVCTTFNGILPPSNVYAIHLFA